MINYINQYNEILNPEKRVSKDLIRPRNIYRITTYENGNPPTKFGTNSRYVFVIGKVDDKIHCLLLNYVPPIEFIKLLNRLKDPVKNIKEGVQLSEVLKSMARDGNQLFKTYIRPNKLIYNKKYDNYRTYFIDKIQYVWEIRFEQDFLNEIFKKNITISKQREIIKKEINERDG
jgi:hypothetical protein